MSTTSENISNEALNIYAAVDYLCREALTDGLLDIHKILEKTAAEILAVYNLNISENDKAKEMIESAFQAFLLLLKFLTCGSEEAKREFLDILSASENILPFKSPGKKNNYA